MDMQPRSLMANIISGVLTAILVIALGYFIYEKQDSFSLFAPSGQEPSDVMAAPKPMASERIDEKHVENELNRIAEEKRAEEARLKAEAEAKRKAEDARKKAAAEAEAKRKAEAEKKRLAELEAKKKAEAEEQKRLNEIALKKKQDEEKKLKEEQDRQKKVAEEKRQQEIAKQKEQDAKKAEEKKQQDAKAAADKKAADEKRKAEEAKKAAEAKAKAEAEAKAEADAKARAEAAENDRIANAYLGNASFVGAMQQALYDNWSTGAEMIGYTATVVFYVDAQGNIVKIDDSKSKYSGFQPFDDSVKAAVWRTKKIKMPDNKHAVNKLVKEGVAVTFDPKDYGFVNY